MMAGEAFRLGTMFASPQFRPDGRGRYIYSAGEVHDSANPI
jgi:hypothetical protein